MKLSDKGTLFGLYLHDNCVKKILLWFFRTLFRVETLILQTLCHCVKRTKI